VFFINLPVGLLAFLGLLIFLPRDRNIEPIRFDLFGFSVLALAVASLQLFLDRGEQLDWFDSPEIIMWAVAACLGLYFTVVHTLTVRGSFVPRGLFRDWNFLVASFLGTGISIASFGSQPLITFMMQQLMGYSALRSGTLVAMASLSSMVGLLVVATPLRKLGVRAIIALGLMLLGWSQVLYASLSLYTDQWPILTAGIVKGAGVGLTMTMLPGITFSTLPAHLRNEGAAFSALVRNMGMSVGVTVTQIMAIRETGIVRARLVEGVRQDNPLLHYAFPGFDFESLPSVAGMGGEIARQSVMVGYVDAFLAAGIMAFLLIPAVMLIRMRR
ncbi:MAG: MFS transporter, partial [Nevskiales bacterium]